MSKDKLFSTRSFSILVSESLPINFRYALINEDFAFENVTLAPISSLTDTARSSAQFMTTLRDSVSDNPSFSRIAYISHRTLI